MPVFLDTNVLIYSIGLNPEDEQKRRTALDLLARGDCVLSIQTLQEFYWQTTRRSRRTPLTHRDACDLILAWLRFRIIENSVELLLSALELKARLNFSYWDCAILAAARAAGWLPARYAARSPLLEVLTDE